MVKPTEMSITDDWGALARAVEPVAPKDEMTRLADRIALVEDENARLRAELGSLRGENSRMREILEDEGRDWETEDTKPQEPRIQYLPLLPTEIARRALAILRDAGWRHV